ncbi:MAG: thioredoxin [Rhodospirillaceae bacterium]|nr:thioredoxin [Rhodospirillaceae bacterium]MBT4218374.1 thioredoxin [Rhodospirillaceae bacterium]MBT4463828.1 thioredoxin [Rhodospirillaceae bacterium]MBT5012870.1 thioredoxin [Rhodospirillaceae bacterium]MBT5308856.1 thioredoxin [Rhodospirillaceae bacterium]
MATIELTDENFEETLTNNDMVVIDFWADWCGPCKMFAPTFEKISEKNPDIAFAKCDTEQQQQLASQFAIQSIPTLAVLRQNVLLFSQPGALPESALEDIVAQAKALDMEEVHANIAAQSESEGEGEA